MSRAGRRASRLDENRPIALRPATPADATAIARIWQAGWRDAHLGHVPEALVAARTPASFSERAPGIIDTTLVATRDTTVIGFVTVERDQVDQLYLDRSARGSGVGAALLDAAEHLVLANGHARAWLAVATGNESARRFYARQGWIDEGLVSHPAPVPGASVAVSCHRFVSPPR